MSLASRWDERIVPRLVDRALDDRLTHRWRRAATAPAFGVVLDIGFGSGRNLPFFDSEVEVVLAVEPSDLAWERSADLRAASPIEVQRIGLDGAAIALADQSVDTAVTTWTLCTIPDVTAALGEIRRVLRPGGLFRFAEHSLAPDPAPARWAHRLQPAWGRLAGGCHLTRDAPALVAEAGFDVEVERADYATPSRLSRPFGWFVTGAATVSA